MELFVLYAAGRGPAFIAIRLVVLSLSILLVTPSGARGHGDIHLQIQEVTKRIEHDPINGDLYLKRGELHRAHQDWDAAEADYDQARALNPKLVILDLVQGKMFLEANWPFSAKVALDRFLIRHTNHVDALITRARVLVKLGRRLEAAQDYSKAIAGAAQPQPETFLERSQALTGEGQAYFEEALRGLDEGIKKLGPLVVLQLYAIDVELKRKRFDTALARLESVAAQSPRKETWLARRGEILQQAGRLKEAREAYQEALKAMAALPPARRQVPKMLELEQRVQLALESTGGPIQKKIQNP